MDDFVIRKPRVQFTTIDECLKCKFKLDEFRGQQREIIESTLEGTDTVVLMHTGGGKSLTYQLPAVMSSGVTLVVSPLLALIQNQVDQLSSLNIKAATLNSTIGKKAKDSIIKDILSASPSLKLLYVTPELLATENFREIMSKVYKKEKFSRLVVDEAHCISEWGQDFRGDYRKLAYWKKEYPKLPIIALTATATKDVYDDIINQLHLNQPKIFVSSFNRTNLHYEVRFKPPDTNDPTDDVLRFLNLVYSNRKKRLSQDNEILNQRVEGVCGIIYCNTRNDCERVSGILKKHQVRSSCYHAGLSQKDRKAILTAWTGTTEKSIVHEKTDNGPSETDVIDVVVATISFGMGIDKKSVRFVIHWDIPKSLEGYYQESGRAGRDGRVSRCILYYSEQDRDRVLFLMRSNSDDKSKQSYKSFEHLVKYCENTKICRHKFIVKYFSVGMPVSDSNEQLCPSQRCDICKEPEKVKQKYDDYKIAKGNYGPVSLIDTTPTTCNSFQSKGFQTARELQKDIRLKDGSLASFEPKKRQYDTFLSGEEPENISTSFQTAGALLGQNFSREYLFGKQGKRVESVGVKTQAAPPKYSLLHYNYELPGCDSKRRDSSIEKIKKAITQKIEEFSPELEFIGKKDDAIESMAIEIEGQLFYTAKLLVTYQNSIVSIQRQIQKCTLSFENNSMVENVIKKHIKISEI